MTSFLEKWSSKKASKPKAGARSAVDTFRARVAEQKAYLEEFERDATTFNKWRSTWFQRVPGGFGVSIGRDAINAGEGLNYIVVETARQVAEFLDDLASHAENDIVFQRALEDNRSRRAALLNTTKAKPAKAKATVAKAAVSRAATAKATVAKAPTVKAAPVTAPAEDTGADKPKRGRKLKA